MVTPDRRRFSRRLQPSDWLIYRVLEIIPGSAVWLTLIAAVVLSIVAPTAAVVFIIIFDVYWLVRVMYVMAYLILAYRRYRQAMRTDWATVVRQHADWRQVYHIVFIPVSKESLEVVHGAVLAIANSQYPLDRVMVVVALEERFADHTRPLGEAIRAEFGSTFAQCIIVEHPDHLVGELAGKGANIAWAGRKVQTIIDELHIPYDRILVTTLDADSVVHPQYFSCLTDAYFRSPHRLRTSYQPIPLFHNNVWQAPPFTRVVANSTTFWLLTETMRPDRLFTFSSHSMPWQALVDVDFWQNDIVTEDSRIFLQCLIRYDGDYRVTPIYIPVSMDMVQGPNAWRSIIAQYKQIRRWAYGVENFPFMAWNFSKNPYIHWARKAKYIWNQLEGVYSWATAPILIFILGWLPFTRLGVPSSALVQNAPYVLRTLMLLAMAGLLISAVVSTMLLPRRPHYVGAYRWLMMILEWVLLPYTMIIFGSIPAIDAQTRLMFGAYLGFAVTEKSRSPEPQTKTLPNQLG